jgi:hypothetical protein
MANILIVYYSSYGHIEAMAQAQAEGAARVPGARVSVKRIPELTPPEIAAAAGFRLDSTLWEAVEPLGSWARAHLGEILKSRQQFDQNAAD